MPSGFNEWRDRFEARPAEPARGGRANAELTAEPSELLDAPVRLESVASASGERVAVSAPVEQVLDALVEALDDETR